MTFIERSRRWFVYKVCASCKKPINDITAMARCLDRWKAPRLRGTR